MSKAEERKLRKGKKDEARKEKLVKFSSTTGNLAAKTVKIAPIPELASKTLKIHEAPTQSKSIYVPDENTFPITECNLTWCTSHSDLDGEWSWREQRQWTEDEWKRKIYPSFSSLEKSTWHEILHEQKVSAKGGKRVPKNHQQEISTLLNEAKDRWISIGLEEYDTAFRFRFTGTIRAWGIKLGGHFYLVWWERKHKIYPVSRV
jgi:hypothetical protein